MTYHLTGDPAWIVALLAILGAMHILTGIETWLRERVSLDLHPLWHVIPRRFRLAIRWDRPHAYVQLPGEFDGVILGLCECDGALGPVALVQPCDDDEDLGPAEWVPVSALAPLPRAVVREVAGK